MDILFEKLKIKYRAFAFYTLRLLVNKESII